MGKYTTDEAKVLPKSEIALCQLEDAISLFLSKRYFSAVTLAGAADDIFCGLLKANGKLSPGERTWMEIQSFRDRGISLAGEITKKEAFRKWNSTRNRLKHHDQARDGPVLEIFESDEAYEWVERACHSASLLGLQPKNRNDFDNSVIPWFFLSD